MRSATLLGVVFLSVYGELHPTRQDTRTHNNNSSTFLLEHIHTAAPHAPAPSTSCGSALPSAVADAPLSPAAQAPARGAWMTEVLRFSNFKHAPSYNNKLELCAQNAHKFARCVRLLPTFSRLLSPSTPSFLSKWAAFVAAQKQHWEAWMRHTLALWGRWQNGPHQQLMALMARASTNCGAATAPPPLCSPQGRYGPRFPPLSRLVVHSSP